jgi:BMFP domain-containing protein YqiC
MEIGVDKDFLKERRIDNQAIRNLAEKLASSVPDGAALTTMRADIERNFRGLLTVAFERLDLVTREEFDVQRKVLERTREKLTALEAELQRLEERLAEPDSD